MESGQHTFLLADLAGYSALTEVHGDEHAADVAAEFGAWVRPLLPGYGAEEVKAIGDALLLRVGEPGAAVHLGGRIVGDFGTRHGSLGVRVGIHTGTAVNRDGDWFGAAVNIASRLADSAQAGEVLVSESTRQLAGECLPAGQLKPRGRQTFKNVRSAVDVFSLAVDTATQLPTDPVCLMAVDPERGYGPVVHHGAAFHFCSERCADAFRADPGRYTRRSSVRDSRLVSDRARERAVGTIRRGYAKGRITGEELEERTGTALAARTRGELRAATHGLPGRHRRVPWPVRLWILLFRWPRRLARRLRRRRR